MPQPIYLTADIRRIEQAAGPDASLMVRAGLAAADLAGRLVSERG
jgi:NAD(P)H-hydrate repair Nnr-like enzyme with NAD(P)H-hydrate epimerase domain